MQQVAKSSVLEGIQLFQHEINKVAVDNVKFPKWKQQRARRKTLTVSVVSLIDSGSDSSHAKPLHFPLRRNILSKDLSPPELPPKERNVTKRVSYAKNEVTVFGSQEELCNFKPAPKTFVNHSLKRSRQIHPNSYFAPEDPPPTDSSDLDSRGNTIQKPVIHNIETESEEEDDEQVPVLPSVKQLANRFQTLKTVESKPKKISNKVNVVILVYICYQTSLQCISLYSEAA